jgi:peptidoglycan/xylan/chitin deacetylase (PgdA/CDA1 family)
VAVKVDVCNHRALHEGLPGLMRTLDRVGVRASFFVTFGPDHSGRALRRILRPGFLTKMIRTRAPRMYGFRTLLYGTLLPGPRVGESGAALLRSVEEAGHDVGLHGFDHVGWQDGIGDLQAEQIRASYTRAISLFESTLGHPPRFTGAPGWRVTPRALEVQDAFGFEWASDCRDGEPFHPVISGRRMRTLQIPTTLPTSDEVLAARSAGADGLDAWYARALVANRLNVVGLHAEAEGIHYAAWLQRWLAGLRSRGVGFARLSDVAIRERERAPSRRVVDRKVPGRAGPVACPERIA